MDSIDPDYSSAEQVIVTAEQMQQIEAALFSAGMPVPALMEKVSGRIADWIASHYPCDRAPTVGVIVGPGHNGGDALVVARELFHQGYDVLPWCPFSEVKALTANHRDYLDYLGIPFAESIRELEFCDVIVDGGFGFGLTRPLEGAMAEAAETINQWDIPVVSIDVPTGLATDTGEALGIAVRACHTLCLGLWKLGLFQDAALSWVGKAHLIPFDIPTSSVNAVISAMPRVQRLTSVAIQRQLPLPRSITAHKYQVGHALLVAGSRRYAGAALLAGKGAIASGVGMLTLVVPESLRPLAVGQLPEALVLGAPETDSGAIAELPADLQLETYDAAACGPGLTLQAGGVIRQIFESGLPLVLDADGLNWLAENTPQESLQKRLAPVLLTPHLGEFRRLFPDILAAVATPSAAAQQAAVAADCTVVLKGAISAIAHGDGRLWFNPDSTAALARGGSGDVLTGLSVGLAAQQFQRGILGDQSLLCAALTAVWWHAQTGRAIAAERTELGCPPSLLAERLTTTLAQML